MSRRTLALVIVALAAAAAPLLAVAQPAQTDVIIESVVPGTLTGNNEWCIGTGPVVITAHVVDLASQSQLTQGTVTWQFCARSFVGVPKEDCDGRGAARWLNASVSNLSADSTPSFAHDPVVPVLGVRILFRPARGDGFKRASVSLNLNTTCSP